MPRLLRSVLVLFAAFTVGGTAVAVVPAAVGADSASSHAAKPHKKKKKKKPAKPPKPVTLARGAVVKYSDVRVNPKRKVRTALLRLDLRNPHIRLGAATPGNAIGAPRQTITTLTRVNRGVGGINADFFKSGQPLGGLVVNGTMLKSPRKGFDANFYIRAGRARIGTVDFSGTVTRAERPAPAPEPPSDDDPTPPTDPPTDPPGPSPATSRALTSVNALRDLGDDRLVLINSGLAAPRFGQACTAVTAWTTAAGTAVVTAVYENATAISRRAGAEFALVACGTGPRATWLRTKIATGDIISVSMSLAGGTPSTLVSGGQVLVNNGRAFYDTDGKTITGRNPESFGCVSRDGAKVVLGTMDGRHEGSSGVTIPELRRYLLGLHCFTAIVFDGGGSSTLVGKPAGRTSVRVLNRPSDRAGARAVTTGLILYRR